LNSLSNSNHQNRQKLYPFKKPREEKSVKCIDFELHDANDARSFIHDCVDVVRKALPDIIVEVRMNGTFFSDEIVRMLDKQAVQNRY
jgi:hypothetical protein